MIIFTGLLVINSCKNEKTGNQDQTDEVNAEWVRPAQEGGNSAAYFSYTNNLDVEDTLRAVSSDIAGMAEVHESYETEDGLMGMREQSEVIVKSGETIEFEQGGLHVMLMQLNKQIQEGDSISIHLELAKAGRVEKELPVLNRN